MTDYNRNIRFRAVWRLKKPRRARMGRGEPDAKIKLSRLKTILHKIIARVDITHKHPQIAALAWGPV